MTIKRLGVAALGLALLAGCGDGASSEESESASPTSATSTEAATEPDTERADEATKEETTVAEETDEATEAPEDARTGEGTFTAPTLSGRVNLTIDAPEGWEAYGVEEAITNFDLITLMKGGTGPEDPLESIIVSDQQIGLDAQGTMESMYQSYGSDAERYSGLTELAPLTLDGTQFVGFEVVSNTQSGTSRIQYWFADIDDTVIGIFVHHGSGDEPMPDELIALRDSLTINPA